MSSFGELYVNWDGIGAPNSGWERPKTGDIQLNIFKAVRDDMLLSIVTDLQLGSTHDIVSLDNEAPSRPLQITWDSELTSTISWIEEHGVIGSGMTIKRRLEDGTDRYVGMIQVAGTILTDFQMKHNAHEIVHQRYSKSRKKWVVGSLINYFGSSWGMAFLGRNVEGSLQLWHKVTAEDWGKMTARVLENCRSV